MAFKNLHALCADVIFGSGGVKTDAAVKKVQEITTSKHENLSILLCILESLDVEVELKSAKNPEFKENFKDFCRKLAKVCFPEDVLKVSLDSMGDDGLGSRYVKMKTKLFYKQLKFNLLREESEGYAKLLVELNQEIVSSFSPICALERVRCLIGQFNLDPNRVLDVILECFEMRLGEYKFFVELLRLFRANSSDVCHILGFKFTFYQDKFTGVVRRRAEDSVYHLAALLVHFDFLDLSSFCSYLTPKLDAMMEENKKYVEEANKKQKKLASSSLASEKDAAAAQESSEFELSKMDDMRENQKLCLLSALLDIGEWKYAKHLLDRMPEFYAVRFVEISQRICRLIERMIDDFYRKNCLVFNSICVANDPPTKYENETDSSDAESCLFVAETRSAATFDDLFEFVFPIAAQLGPAVAYDPILFTKLIRICSTFLDEKAKNAELEPLNPKLLEFCEDVLVPALSLLKDNCPVSEELWLLIKQFPYTTRYRFYGRWRNEHMKRHPALIAVRGEITGKTRYIMKRLSKETTKSAGRQIGKLCHGNAIVIFDYILNQIQQFENLIGPVVESLKFVTNLSYDVLAYCIIEHLSSPEKEKLKVSDATLSPWLQSLAQFVGSVFKKYTIELTGVLQYVANQLKTGKSFDLCVLREIIENMSGVETTAGLTQEQLEASAGGDILRQEAGFFGQARNTKRSINRLKDALMQEDLVVSLCILMAQQRGSIVFDEGTSIHLKLVGQMLDQCQETLVQFASFLSMNLKPEDYVKHMPTALELMHDYHVNSDAAMFLSRPVYSYLINSTYDELKRVDRANKSLNLEKKTQHYKSAWNQVLTPLTEEIMTVFPVVVWQDISPKLFASFWMLSMFDVNVPTASYERELDKMRKAVQQIDDSRDAGDAKRKKEKENKLSEEQRRQMEHVSRVQTQLNAEKDEWFATKSQKAASVTQFLQICLFPRCVFTDLDAIFCAKFVQLVHSLKTPNFSTLICYDRIFCDVSPMISCMSEYESNRYGRFLCAALETVMRWHKDSETFDKECSNFPGFVTKFRAMSTAPQNAASKPPPVIDDAKEIVDYESYRHVVHKWHFKMTKAFIVTLGSGSYVQIRNSLLVLIKILPHYPVVRSMSDTILKKVIALRDVEKDKRQDLHVLAASYGGHLKLKKAPIVNESEFHSVTNKEAKQQQATLAAPTKLGQLSATVKKATDALKVVSTTGAADKIEESSAVKTVAPAVPQKVVINTTTTKDRQVISSTVQNESAKNSDGGGSTTTDGVPKKTIVKSTEQPKAKSAVPTANGTAAATVKKDMVQKSASPAVFAQPAPVNPSPNEKTASTSKNDIEVKSTVDNGVKKSKPLVLASIEKSGTSAASTSTTTSKRTISSPGFDLTKKAKISAPGTGETTTTTVTVKKEKIEKAAAHQSEKSAAAAHQGEKKETSSGKTTPTTSYSSKQQQAKSSDEKKAHEERGESSKNGNLVTEVVVKGEVDKDVNVSSAGGKTSTSNNGRRTAIGSDKDNKEDKDDKEAARKKVAESPREKKEGSKQRERDGSSSEEPRSKRQRSSPNSNNGSNRHRTESKDRKSTETTRRSSRNK